MPLSGDFYLTKVPILDDHQRIFGYFLSIKNREDEPVSVNELADLLVNVNLEKIAGSYPVFLKVNNEVIKHDILDYIPAEKTVLLLSTDDLTDEDVQLIKELKNVGFRFAFEYGGDLGRISEIFDYIFTDVNQIDSDIYQHRDKVILTGIFSTEEFKQLLNEGFRYFKGDFIFKPSTIVEKKIDPSKLAVMELFTKVRENFNPPQIEEIIKRNPDLSISLLKYVNSAAFSFRSKITSIRHAISILGQRNLLQWLLLFLYRAGSDSSYAETLLEVSAERGKTLEILAQKLNLSDEEVEKSFLVGILSLVDKLIGISPEELIKELNLDEEIVKAIVEKEGILGKLLNIVEKTEEGKIADIADVISSLGLNLNDVMSAQLQAFAWFEEVNIV
ncbi:HDOD domain-containing protein [Persephonella atlantica]|uniref:HDOD domain-containing protein n=1 Tax=Persephonella atlantica TaxID=2699429 RepID=A0ABS1GJM5_9AQUI|nr:HDOD domain-containing protein [Persephonella atlantica]MBK3333133.1 HDOD domain-containing protein [Persephonella atlantica]